MSLPFDELADGVFRRRYASLDLNIGVIVGGDGVLVVDTRASHGQAGELIGEMRRLTTLPVRWVVNSHWHWDHVFGNSMFPDAHVWGHRNCREFLLSRADEGRRAALQWAGEDGRAAIESVVIRAPDRLIDTNGSIDVGGRSVRMEWLGLGHTDADLVVSVPDAGVVFAGDLLENGAPPYFGDGFPLAWRDTAAAVLARVVGTTVPGHGDVMDKDAVAGQAEELAAVASACTDGLTSGVFDPTQGPYPESTMATAWSRAKAEVAG